MAKAICPECNNRSGNWIYKNTERRYTGDGYDFTVNVNLPYCEKCGSLVYDGELEDKIREDVHAMIEEKRGKLSK